MRAPACTRTHAHSRSPLPRLPGGPQRPPTPCPGPAQPADGWGAAVPAPAGDVSEASVNSEKSGLGWQEGSRGAAAARGGEGRAESRGVAGRGGSGWVQG